MPRAADRCRVRKSRTMQVRSGMRRARRWEESMRTMTRSIVALLALAAVLPFAAAQTEQYPSRPITIIVPFPPGGSSDVVTRLVAAKFADNLKANVVIDNRGGGGGVPAAIAGKQMAPDGYTLFLANNGLFAIMPALTADI